MSVQSMPAVQFDFQSLADGLPQLLWLTSREGDASYVNPQWIAHTGLPGESSLGQGWKRALHSDDAECAAVAWQDAAQHRAAVTVQLRLRAADGAYHWCRVQVIPMVGPCSLVLALMASGLSGQSFAFHGYLPSEAQEREKRLRELEKESRQQQRTQIFIETPYRNRQMLASLINTCAPGTRICVATDLTLAEEQITTRPVADWRRQQLPETNRRPTVFLLQA